MRSQRPGQLAEPREEGIVDIGHGSSSWSASERSRAGRRGPPVQHRGSAGA
jgi:hypothetical protein